MRSNHAMSRFKPPIHDLLGLSLVKLSLPLAMRHQRLTVSPSKGCLEQLHRLRGQHVAIFANHSDRHDPMVVFALSQVAGEEFNYMAARELFDMNFGFRGWVLQRCGCYSVIRGETDRDSIDMTRKLLIAGKRKLVMFPEGDVSGTDSRIQKVKRGPVRVAFEAQQALLERNNRCPVYILPMAIQYDVGPDAAAKLSKALVGLERELQLPYESLNLEQRINRVTSTLLQHLQNYYNVVSWESGDFDTRLKHICRQIITRFADYAGTALDTTASEAAMLHELRGKLSSRSSDIESDCAYCRRLAAKSKERKALTASDLNRVQRLLILSNTLRQQYSLEMAWKVVDRLEKEILGEVSRKSERCARIASAEPISLLDHMQMYEQNAEAATSLVADLAQEAMNAALTRMKTNFAPRIMAA